MRVKLVISSTIDGATDSSVMMITICSATLTSPFSPVPSRPMFSLKGVELPGFEGELLVPAPLGVGSAATLATGAGAEAEAAVVDSPTSGALD